MHLTQSKIRNPKSAMCPGGFTFVEVLFAVMILGIGFIMIAGVFPVALSQTQLNGDETVGAALARNGVHYLESLGYAQLAPPTGPMSPDGVVHAFSENAVLWDNVKGNLVLPEDPRYAWVPFYRRGTDPYGQPASSAQVIVVAVRARTKSRYDPTDLTAAGPLAPKAVNVTLKPSTAADQADTITFSGGAAGAIDAVAPGMYVVLARDSGANGTDNASGWVFKVGANTKPGTPAGPWELVEGNDMKSAAYKPTGGSAYVIGQAYDPGANAVGGGAQDIAVYTSFIQLH